MYVYLAKVGFEPTPTSTAAPSNTETTVIPTRPLRSLNKELSWSFYARFLCITRRIGLQYFVVLTQSSMCIQGIPGSYGYRSLEINYYIKDIQAPTDIPAKDHF